MRKTVRPRRGGRPGNVVFIRARLPPTNPAGTWSAFHGSTKWESPERFPNIKGLVPRFYRKRSIPRPLFNKAPPELNL